MRFLEFKTSLDKPKVTIALFVCLSVCLSVCQSVCLPVGRSVGLSVCLFVCFISFLNFMHRHPGTGKTTFELARDYLCNSCGLAIWRAIGSDNFLTSGDFFRVSHIFYLFQDFFVKLNICQIPLHHGLLAFLLTSDNSDDPSPPWVMSIVCFSRSHLGNLGSLFVCWNQAQSLHLRAL